MPAASADAHRVAEQTSLHAASMNVEYPMLFNVTNRQTGRATHCGVLEFIADEGVIYMPYWVRACAQADVVATRLNDWVCTASAQRPMAQCWHHAVCR